MSTSYCAIEKYQVGATSDFKDLNDLSLASTQVPDESDTGPHSLESLEFPSENELEDVEEDEFGLHSLELPNDSELKDVCDENEVGWDSLRLPKSNDLEDVNEMHRSDFPFEHLHQDVNEMQRSDVPFELGRPDGSTGGFYGVMRKVRSWRSEVCQILFNDVEGRCSSMVSHPALASLEVALRSTSEMLQAIPRPPGWCKGGDDNVHMLAADPATTINVRLQYEKNELNRDIEFMNGGEVALLDRLKEDHRLCMSAGLRWVEAVPTWQESLEKAVLAMHAATRQPMDGHAQRFRNFITDRDGTINNYCDRYASSVQSAYNAVCVSNFARQCTQNTVLLTAAPLGGRPGAEGLMELCTMPQGSVVYAGSKGREYYDNATRQVREVEPLPAKVRDVLTDLYQRLVKLCSEPCNSKFLGLGSGLQFKFGEVTMARNDPAGNVCAEESCRFMADVQRVMREIDPAGVELDMHDTGTDMEIFPRLADGRPSFNKGNGVIGLDQKLGLRVAEGPNLVCGDTSSDVPMVESTLRLMGGARPASNLAVLFVVTAEQHHRSPTLAARVCEICQTAGAHCAILPSPDTLIAALAQYTRESVANDCHVQS